jgi:sedoheptulose-bisphosphatase
LGDKQLVADIEADAQIMNVLRGCEAVAVASSEEQPEDILLHPEGSFSVAFDPLDGSSIIAANWAVGSIFAVFPGNGFIHRSGRDQIAAAYAVHGPRTVLVLARPQGASTANFNLTPHDDGGPAEKSVSNPCVVQEYVMVNDDKWVLNRDNVKIEPRKKVFAPANLRASADNAAYGALVTELMKERYTLRYSGGMVPDVHHIVAKGGGVFCNPRSASAPAKLRCLYEVLPLAFVVEAAGGGSTTDGENSALDVVLRGHDDRSTVCLGSIEEVQRSRMAMGAGSG